MFMKMAQIKQLLSVLTDEEAGALSEAAVLGLLLDHDPCNTNQGISIHLA